jgi:hypothetical protein
MINLSHGTQFIWFTMPETSVKAQSILITGDGRHLFRVSMGTHLDVWNVRDKAKVFNFGFLTKIINCICD